MPWLRYLTDAERPYRPEAVRAAYPYRVTVTLRGLPFTRWFRSQCEADAYQAECTASEERYRAECDRTRTDSPNGP